MPKATPPTPSHQHGPWLAGLLRGEAAQAQGARTGGRGGYLMRARQLRHTEAEFGGKGDWRRVLRKSAVDAGNQSEKVVATGYPAVAARAVSHSSCRAIGRNGLIFWPM
jgi:hypothetical protein